MSTDNILTDAVVQNARDASVTADFNTLPAFPAIPQIPETGAPERDVTDEGVTERNNVNNVDNNGALVNAPPVELATEPVNIEQPRSAPVRVASPFEAQGLDLTSTELPSAGATDSLLTVGEDASFATQAGPLPNAVLPDVNNLQQLRPDVLYNADGFNVQSTRVLTTDILNDWVPRRVAAEQRAQERAWFDRVSAGLEIRNEMNGTLAPLDMVTGQLPRDARLQTPGNRTVRGFSGLGEAAASWLVNLVNPSAPDVTFGGFGDFEFGNSWVGGAIQAVSTLQNTTIGALLDVANNVQSGVRAAANTPWDLSDFVNNVTAYQNEFRRDGDPTTYMTRAARGDDLGFSNYGRMQDGRVNPLGLWGVEGNSEVSEALRFITAGASIMRRDRYGVPTQSAIDARTTVANTSSNAMGRAALMATGLVLDVLTDPTDFLKAIARLTGTTTSTAAASLRGVNTELPEMASAALQSRRAEATLIPDPWLTAPLPNNNVLPPVVENLVPVAQRLPDPWAGSYYSPSAIVNEIISSNVSAPTLLRGSPDFAVNSVENVRTSINAAAPALSNTLNATPLPNLATLDSVVLAGGNEALTLVPNVLRPVSRQLPETIAELASGTVKLDVDTLLATLPRNVEAPTTTRLTLYNNATDAANTMLPATPAPQRVYSPPTLPGISDSLFPVSIESARPLVDEIAAAPQRADSMISRANRFLTRLADQGYVQITPDYAAFVTSTKADNAITYVNNSNLRRVRSPQVARRMLRNSEQSYVNLANDVSGMYRQTRLLETLAPSALRTPDMFNELAKGYAPNLPAVPNRRLASLIDDVVSAEDNFINTTATLRRLEAEASNVNLQMRNVPFNTGYVNETGTVRRLSNGGVVRTSATSVNEKDFLRALHDVDSVVSLRVDVKNSAPNTYTVDGVPANATPLVKNGKLNVLPETGALDEVVTQLDDLVVNMHSRGYVHFDLVNSVYVKPDGTVLLADNLHSARSIASILGESVNDVELLDDVLRTERSIVLSEVSRLRDGFDVDAYELGNAAYYETGKWRSPLERAVGEFDAAPSDRALANTVRYQTKYELDRVSAVARREVEAALVAREEAVNAFSDAVAKHNERANVLSAESARRRQQRVDAELSRDRGTCL